MKELAFVYLAREAMKVTVRKYDVDVSGGVTVASDYSAEKLWSLQDDLKYWIYLD